MKYKWIGESDDGAYHEESHLEFYSQGDCYLDMMHHAIDKMKWNVNYDDVTSDCVTKEKNGLVTSDSPIHYNAQFYPDKIIHESYSGVYTYTIVQIT